MGKIARITNDGKLLIKGKFIEEIGEIDGSIIPDEEFTTVGTHTFTVPEGVTSIDYVVIAGGGGGGGSNNGIRGSGGGGAGGVLIGTMPISSTSYEVVVGDGGIGGTGRENGQNGSNSSFGNIIAIGGGAGGWADNGSEHDGNDGGSGGGAGGQIGIAGISLGQGNDGGKTTGAGLGRGGAGGGGATSAGQDGMSNLGGNGGAGIEINGKWYAGGGGGGMSGGGLGGSGVGGKGNGSNAVANTGSGGGGVNGVGSTGGNGSSGVVFIYYKNIRKPVTPKLTASGDIELSELIELEPVKDDAFYFMNEPLGDFDKFEKFLYPSTGWQIVEKEIESGKGIERVLENYFSGNQARNGYGIGYTLDNEVDWIDISATIAVGHQGGLALMDGRSGYISSIRGLLYDNIDENRSDNWVSLGTFTNKTVLNKWYKTRMHWDIEGNIKVKVWDVDTTEPDLWDIEIVDKTYIPNRVGVVLWQRGYYGWVKDFTVKYSSPIPISINSDGKLIVTELIENAIL